MVSQGTHHIGAWATVMSPRGNASRGPHRREHTSPSHRSPCPKVTGRGRNAKPSRIPCPRDCPLSAVQVFGPARPPCRPFRAAVPASVMAHPARVPALPALSIRGAMANAVHPSLFPRGSGGQVGRGTWTALAPGLPIFSGRPRARHAFSAMASQAGDRFGGGVRPHDFPYSS